MSLPEGMYLNQERRNARTQERRNAGTPERRNAGILKPEMPEYLNSKWRFNIHKIAEKTNNSG